MLARRGEGQAFVVDESVEVWMRRPPYQRHLTTVVRSEELDARSAAHAVDGGLPRRVHRLESRRGRWICRASAVRFISHDHSEKRGGGHVRDIGGGLGLRF